jgi:hypothetical protein
MCCNVDERLSWLHIYADSCLALGLVSSRRFASSAEEWFIPFFLSYFSSRVHYGLQAWCRRVYD